MNNRIVHVFKEGVLIKETPMSKQETAIHKSRWAEHLDEEELRFARALSQTMSINPFPHVRISGFTQLGETSVTFKFSMEMPEHHSSKYLMKSLESFNTPNQIFTTPVDGKPLIKVLVLQDTIARDSITLAKALGKFATETNDLYREMLADSKK